MNKKLTFFSKVFLAIKITANVSINFADCLFKFFALFFGKNTKINIRYEHKRNGFELGFGLRGGL